MEQASDSIMTGIRAFSAHLSLTFLLYYCCGPLLLFVYFQVKTSVLYLWIMLKTSTLLVMFYVLLF